MDTWLWVLLGVVGVWTVARNVYVWSDGARLRHFTTTNVKAQRWVRWVGEERAIELNKRVFLPMGTVVGVILVAVCTWRVWSGA